MVRFGVAAVLFLFAVLLWASRAPGPSQVPFINLTSILIGSSALAMVLIYGSLSGVMCERAGVVNIAIEGQFIGGALFGSVIASTTNNFLLAALAGAVAGGLLGLILAFLSLRYLSDQIIVGVVLVTMMSSLSSYLNLQVLSPYPNLNTGNLASNIAIPLLYKIPIIGPVFFNQSGFFYFMIILVGLISFGLFKTRWGLRVRAVGEHPKAAESVGINVIRTRYINVVSGGAIAGVGGVAFMASQGAFQVGYTSGLGYVALAALIFGRWRPSGAVTAAVLFGISVYLADNLQTYQIPVSTEILGMFPYIITILVVAGLVGRVRPPGADGKPYKRD
jgi:simple sugar transport system permease protein